MIVADAHAFPAHIAPPAAVAPIDLHGQPMPGPAEPLPGMDGFGQEGVPLSVVASTYDSVAHVLRGGSLVARSPLALRDHARWLALRCM